MSALAKILDRLDRPKQTRPGQWVAGCPCCQSKRGRPISIRENDDGRVLLNPFCGCETGDVLAALGLTLADLFERPIANHVPPSSSRISPRDLLQLLDEEILVAAIIAHDFLNKRALAETEWQRLAKAAARIGVARDHACNG